MPDIDEIVELLQRRAEELNASLAELVGHSRDRVTHILEDEGLGEFPQRVTRELSSMFSSLVDAITAGGTLPAISLPSLSGSSSGKGQRIPILPPPPPPTAYERAIAHVRSRPILYSALAGVTLSLSSLIVAINVSRSARSSIFAHFPALRLLHLRDINSRTHRSRKALPPTPRPRLLADGKHRLEAVLILGCDYGSYGREVAKAFERKGFVVIATVSSASEIDDLERSGSGFIKAIPLDPVDPGAVQGFSRHLNTALSLRYPLNSAGDPFRHISASSPGLQLTSIINCIPLCPVPSVPYLSLPIEAMQSRDSSTAMQAILSTPLAILRASLPLLRSTRDTLDGHAWSSVVTCLPAPERYLGTPFAGSFRGIAANALSQSLDVLRREIGASNVSGSSTDSRRRQIKVVTVDVGFLAPVSTKRTHRGATLSPDLAPVRSSSAAEVEAGLPGHLRGIYAPALISNLDVNADRLARRHLKSAVDLGERLLKVVLAKKASHVSDRISFGAGVSTYYVASLLPTSFIDSFFAVRQRLLTSVYMRRGVAIQAPAASSNRVGEDRKRRKLPLPGEVTSDTSFSSSAGASDSEGGHATTEAESQAVSPGSAGMHESDTILPAYAPNAPASNEGNSLPQSSVASPKESDAEAAEAGYSAAASVTGYDSQEENARSTVLGESYVRV